MRAWLTLAWLAVLAVASTFVNARALENDALGMVLGSTRGSATRPCYAVQPLRPFSRVWRISVDCPADAAIALAIIDEEPLYALRGMPPGAVVRRADLIAREPARLLARSLRSIEEPFGQEDNRDVEAGDRVALVDSKHQVVAHARVSAVVGARVILEVGDPDRTAVLSAEGVTVEPLQRRSKHD